MLTAQQYSLRRISGAPRHSSRSPSITVGNRDALLLHGWDTRILTLPGYHVGQNTFVDFNMTPRDFPTSVIREYTWRGEDDEIKFDGVEVNGFLLTALDGDMRVWNTVDKDFAILSTILPFIWDQTEKDRLNACLVEITKWHSCRRK